MRILLARHEPQADAAARCDRPFAGVRLLVVVAHPDDETLFAGAQLGSCRELRIVHTTDGATTRRAARQQGFDTRAQYGAARRVELQRALAVGGISAECECLGYRDQSLTYHMATAAVRLAATIARMQPDAVLTHAYEGGHRDHDATCFAVHHAVRCLRRPIPVWEFAGYHVRDGRSVRHAFAEATGGPVLNIALDRSQREIKQRMLACFETQRDIVQSFHAGFELFRPAPDHDFARPPFAGRLGYEKGYFARSSRHWRMLAVIHATVFGLLLRTGLIASSTEQIPSVSS